MRVIQSTSQTGWPISIVISHICAIEKRGEKTTIVTCIGNTVIELKESHDDFLKRLWLDIEVVFK